MYTRADASWFLVCGNHTLAAARADFSKTENGDESDRKYKAKSNTFWLVGLTRRSGFHLYTRADSSSFLVCGNRTLAAARVDFPKAGNSDESDRKYKAKSNGFWLLGLEMGPFGVHFSNKTSMSTAQGRNPCRHENGPGNSILYRPILIYREFLSNSPELAQGRNPHTGKFLYRTQN